VSIMLIQFFGQIGCQPCSLIHQVKSIDLSLIYPCVSFSHVYHPQWFQIPIESITLINLSVSVVILQPSFCFLHSRHAVKLHDILLQFLIEDSHRPSLVVLHPMFPLNTVSHSYHPRVSPVGFNGFKTLIVYKGLGPVHQKSAILARSCSSRRWT